MALQRIALRGRNKVIWNRNLVVAGGATSLPTTAPRCGWCGEEHKTREHMCPVERCTARRGQTCKHITAKCVNCHGPNFAQANVCPKKRETRKEAKGCRSPPPPMQGARGQGPRGPWGSGPEFPGDRGGGEVKVEAGSEPALEEMEE